jgi:hypothetical protein
MEMFLPAIYSLPLLNIAFAAVLLWVWMSMKVMSACCFMAPGHIPSLPKDGNAECVLWQGTALSAVRACAVLQWHIVSMWG